MNNDREITIYEEKNNDLTFQLTNRKVRFNSVRNGSGKVVSIMLEHITSCEIDKSCNISLAVLAAISISIGVTISYINDKSTSFYIGLFISIIFFIAFFASKKLTIYIFSSTSKIELNANNLSLENAIKYIDKIEYEVNDRYCQSGGKYTNDLEETVKLVNELDDTEVIELNEL